MAAKTVFIARADGGAFNATLTFDDVTLVCSTINYDLIVGTAEVVYDSVTRVQLPAGLGKTVPVPGSRQLNLELGISFVWRAP